MVTTDEIPVEYTFMQGSKHNSETLERLSFNLEEGNRVYADAGYTNYKIEGMHMEAEKIDLLVQGKAIQIENMNGIRNT